MLASRVRLLSPLAPVASAIHAGRSRLMFRPVYQWFYLLAALDVLFTSIILHLGGTELNALACWLFREHGALGLLVLKTVCATVVVVICEIVGRRQIRLGRLVALLAVGANTVPVTVGLLCLGTFALHLL